MQPDIGSTAPAVLDPPGESVSGIAGEVYRGKGKPWLPPPEGLEWPRDTGTILDEVGNTPVQVVCLENGSRIVAKLEWENPTGSSKDRTATMMLTAARHLGHLRDEHTILESSSGNTGIALAAFGRALGHEVMLCVSETVPEGHTRILRRLGAKVVLSAGHLGSDGAWQRSLELNASDPDRYFLPQQYDNPANPWAHYLSTGPELWEQCEGTITHFVASVGTGGTVMGTGQYLRERNPDVEIIAVQPDEEKHRLFGMRHLGSTKMPGIFRYEGIHDIVEVPTERAYEACRRAWREEDLLGGASSGAALEVAHRLAQEEGGRTVACILPDSRARYLDTGLCEGYVRVDGRELTALRVLIERVVQGRQS